MGKKKDSEKDFSSYISSALQNSMVTGIPQIAAAGNIPKKIVRALVFIFCVIGFIYQTLTFLNIYWEHHTIVDVQITTSRMADLPAVTICNRNGLYMSKICKKRSDWCFKPEPDYMEEFCKCNPRYCEDGVYPENFSFVMQHKIGDFENKGHKDIQEFLQPAEELIDACELLLLDPEKYSVFCDDFEVIAVRSPSRMFERNVCYTKFSLVGKPDEEAQKVLTNGYIHFQFSPHPEEYLIAIPDVSVQIGFHEARSLVNPHIHGFRLLESKGYDFVLKKVVKKLLPPPYETNCFDYLKVWKERGGHGPLNEVDCIQQCMLNASLKLFNCAVASVTYPNNEDFCPMKPVTKEWEVMSAECAKDCAPACLDTTYVVKKEERVFGQADCGEMSTVGEISANAALDNMETTTYIYKPQYEDIEIFSYVGGYVGMWLGISLVAAFDFIETIVMLMRYPLSKLKFRRGGSRRVRSRNVNRVVAY